MEDNKQQDENDCTSICLLHGTLFYSTDVII